MLTPCRPGHCSGLAGPVRLVGHRTARGQSGGGLLAQEGPAPPAVSSLPQLPWAFRVLQTTVAKSRAPSRTWCVLLSLAPYVYGDGVLRVWHAGDAGQCAGEALPRVPSSWVSALLGAGGVAIVRKPRCFWAPVFIPANVLGVTLLLGPVGPLLCRAIVPLRPDEPSQVQQSYALVNRERREGKEMKSEGKAASLGPDSTHCSCPVSFPVGPSLLTIRSVCLNSKHLSPCGPGLMSLPNFIADLCRHHGVG